jgi:hypothetical protein
MGRIRDHAVVGMSPSFSVLLASLRSSSRPNVGWTDCYRFMGHVRADSRSPPIRSVERQPIANAGLAIYTYTHIYIHTSLSRVSTPTREYGLRRSTGYSSANRFQSCSTNWRAYVRREGRKYPRDLYTRKIACRSEILHQYRIGPCLSFDGFVRLYVSSSWMSLRGMFRRSRSLLANPNPSVMAPGNTEEEEDMGEIIEQGGRAVGYEHRISRRRYVTHRFLHGCLLPD